MYNVIDIEGQVSLMNVDLYGVQFKGMLMKAEALVAKAALMANDQQNAPLSLWVEA